jgi:hypothetical protein
MSAIGPTTKESRDDVSAEARGWRGMLRRLAITLTDGGTWQMIGHTMLNRRPEVRRVEMFSGIGFAARPAAGANAEAVVAFVGGSSNPVSLAARDEDGRQSAVGDLGQNETAMYNGSVVFICRENGTAEIRSVIGTPHALATKADIDALAAKVDHLVGVYNSHTHAVSGAVAGITVQVEPGTTPVAVGTLVLKGQ